MSGWKQYNVLAWFLIAIGGWSAVCAQSSVLAEGPWLRIGVTRTGVYKLDAAFLTRVGLPTAGIDPRTFRLYGNGGAPLPQANARNRPQDLTENAIWITGEADGRFDGGDAIYFFARSPHTVFYDSTAGRMAHRINPYSDTTYYYLSAGGSAGQRIATSAFSSSSASPVTYFDDYRYQENDLLNRVQSGREWFGEYIGTTLPVSFTVPGRLNGAALLTMAVLGEATANTTFRLRWGNETVGTVEVPGVSGVRYDRPGREGRQTFRMASPPPSDAISLTIIHDRNGIAGQGFLNFLAIQTPRELRRYDGQWTFRTLETTKMIAARYRLRGADAAMQIWDVTQPLRPLRMPVVVGAQESSMVAPGGALREFLVFSPEQAYQPETAVRIGNQNLQAQPTPELLIVTPAAWKSQADRLAAFRRQNEGLNVLVATTQAIYNEFSSGQPDPTAIRDFARFLRNKTPDRIRYVLLFGDATYDYKNYMKLMSAASLAATVPVYESRESLHPVLSFSSDDYFGFLKPTDGEWEETFAGDHTLDVGIGRLPVRTTEEARQVVDKLIRYSTEAVRSGDWRTRIAFVADDGDANIHQQDALRMAGQLTDGAPGYRAQRILVDNYAQETTSTGQRAPDVNQAITQALDAGRLIINYTGHGGVSGWAEEQILTLQDILSWKNQRLPVFVTATCEFGRYDDPAKVSGAELALLHSRSGGIALLTTTRPVYANTNFLLNQAFYGALTEAMDKRELRLGDLVRVTKNNSLSGSLNRNFALLGDPSMPLAYPKADVTLTHLNGKLIRAGRVDTLRALQTVTFEGEVRLNGQRLSDFSGLLNLTVYDKPGPAQTRGNKGPALTYQESRGMLFNGRASVRNGRFSCRFVVPSSADETFGEAQVVVYAIRSDSLLDAAGGSKAFVVGGKTTATVVDQKPPAIRLFINDTIFVSGQTVAGPRATLIVRTYDENGMNIASNGTGHELTMWINDGEPTVLNDFFRADTDDFRKGTVRYPLTDLKSGNYTVRVKGRDVYNNPSEAALTFQVSDQPELTIGSVQAGPNPFRDEVIFTLTHNRPGDDLEAVLRIVDLNGRLITEQTYQCTACETTWRNLRWDGSGASLTDFRMYVYQWTVRARSDNSVGRISGKLLNTR